MLRLVEALAGSQHRDSEQLMRSRGARQRSRNRLCTIRNRRYPLASFNGPLRPSPEWCPSL